MSSAVIASSSNCRERIKERGERLDLTWEQLWHLCSRFGRPHLAAVAASCSRKLEKTPSQRRTSQSSCQSFWRWLHGAGHQGCVKQQRRSWGQSLTLKLKAGIALMCSTHLGHDGLLSTPYLIKFKKSQ